MATIIRPDISRKNKYWINKHRHYELKHFCLQYPEWKRECRGTINIRSSVISMTPSRSGPSDPTASHVIRKTRYLERIELIERIAREADEEIHSYILKGVTEGLSYTYMKSQLKIPCGKDMYYDRYRRFFWLLSKERN